MSVSDEARLRQAIRGAVQGDGETFWMPEMTTHQRRHSETVRRALEETGLDGATVFVWTDWLVWYRAQTGLDPDASTPAWTEHLLGTVAHGVTGGYMVIDDDTDVEHLYYTISLPTLDNDAGTILEAHVKIETSTAGVNEGSCLGIYDGTYMFLLWLRADGFNIDGEVDFPFDLSTAHHRVRFVAQGGYSEVWIDGTLRQQGAGWLDLTAKTQVSFGSYNDSP